MSRALGSWRGVPFYTVAHDRSSGRRQPTYAIPFVEGGAVSLDLGMQPMEITITAVVVGNDYKNQRDDLIAALDEPGPGLLIHPDYGRITCVVSDKYRVSENTEELLQAKISFTLVQTLTGEQEARKRDPAQALAKTAMEARTIAATSVTSSVPWPAVSDFVQAARLTCVDQVIRDLTAVNNKVAAVLNVPSTYAAQIRALANQTSSLLSTPAKLVSSIAEVMDAVVYATKRVMGTDGGEHFVQEVTATTGALTDSNARAQAVSAFSGLGTETPTVPEIHTVERDAQRQERLAVLAGTQAMGLCTVAAAVADYRYDSAQDAMAFRDQLVGKLLALSDQEGIEPAMSDSLRDTASAVLAYFKTTVLRDLTWYTPSDTLPIEVIAYYLYQDPDRADEIVSRNNIPDPGMVRPQALEVLTS